MIGANLWIENNRKSSFDGLSSYQNMLEKGCAFVSRVMQSLIIVNFRGLDFIYIISFTIICYEAFRLILILIEWGDIFLWLIVSQITGSLQIGHRFSPSSHLSMHLEWYSCGQLGSFLNLWFRSKFSKHIEQASSTVSPRLSHCLSLILSIY